MWPVCFTEPSKCLVCNLVSIIIIIILEPSQKSWKRQTVDSLNLRQQKPVCTTGFFGSYNDTQLLFRGWKCKAKVNQAWNEGMVRIFAHQ